MTQLTQVTRAVVPVVPVAPVAVELLGIARKYRNARNIRNHWNQWNHGITRFFATLGGLSCGIGFGHTPPTRSFSGNGLRLTNGKTSFASGFGLDHWSTLEGGDDSGDSADSEFLSLFPLALSSLLS